MELQQLWKRIVKRLTLFDFKIYSKITVINIVWYHHKGTHMDKWNKIECSEISLYICGQFVFGKGAKVIQLNKQDFFSKNGTKTNRYLYEKINMSLFLCHHKKLTWSIFILKYKHMCVYIMKYIEYGKNIKIGENR